MTIIILVRHGETYANRSNTYSGWNDVGLNDNGERQAVNIAQKLASEKIDCVYSSTLRRALETAGHICRAHDIMLHTTDNLKELNFGRWEGMHWGEVEKKYTREFKQWCTDWINYKIPGGESAVEFYRRCVSEIDRIIEAHKRQKVVVVTHHGCIRNILAHLIGNGLSDSWRFKVANGSISRIEIVDDYAVLTQLNDCSAYLGC
ncbi:MAG: alpha-ribazole phosphatase [Clostridia bacterium]|nr:alpha-ribazole phosphatase [Clostridia bacterium]